MAGLQQAQRDVSTIFGAFAHHRRRYALRGLRMHENPMSVADLADEVAIRENESPVTEIPAEEVKRVSLSLYHTHIPKLAAANLVQYDRERDSVALTERVEEIEQYRALLTVE
ncbi:hypothetical protein CV102_04760 [Natronococcus pandeyae]|uniref:DUF7344 domain-containing protein n=1 Tax=Natronococcus pandeyae TaxID=2055836 RepID=A0A8J8Q3M8_9EURY|nr:hypothetical protein [Natronococcus pandeyae]TYL39605.1 hypothetical protein CV102_04760 [Natronococcus pandeyae]